MSLFLFLFEEIKTAYDSFYTDLSRYHHLNHHAIFGGGYRSGAMSIMQKLIGKYGDGK